MRWSFCQIIWTKATSHKNKIFWKGVEGDRFSLSEVALCNSSSAKVLSPNFSNGISSKNVIEEMDLQNYQAQLQNIFDVAASSPLASSSMELCSQEVCVFIKCFSSSPFWNCENANLKDYSSDSFFKCKFMELDDFSFI